MKSCVLLTLLCKLLPTFRKKSAVLFLCEGRSWGAEISAVLFLCEGRSWGAEMNFCYVLKYRIPKMALKKFI